MRTDLVPIMYIGGTGGSFLSFLLDSTIVGTSKSFKPTFTKHGSAHLMPRLTTTIPMQVDLPVDYQLDAIINYQLDGYDADNPMYVCMHMSIIKEIMAYVKKAILITYTESDIHDILSVCLAKRWLDGLYHSDGTRFDSVIDETDITSLTEKYNEHLKLLIDYQDKFKPCTDFGNRILNISWSEIMNEDTNDFVSKLSDFINRDIDKFDVDVIHEWQQRTKKCIRYMQPIISKIKEQHE